MDQSASQLSLLTLHSELFTLHPGRVVGLIGPPGLGLTRVGMALLAEHSRSVPVAVLDVQGWVSPPAAWEVGIAPGRLVMVRCPDRRLWPQVVAALLEGVRAVYAEVPSGVRDQDLRRLAALARARRARLALRPLHDDLPSGVSHLRLRAISVEWWGADRGHGRLAGRRLVVEASGKGIPERQIEVEDDGTDALRVVSRLGVAQAGGYAG